MNLNKTQEPYTKIQFASLKMSQENTIAVENFTPRTHFREQYRRRNLSRVDTIATPSR